MQLPLGLTSAEAAERHRTGQGNRVELKTSRSVWDIIRANLFSIPNTILLMIMAILISVGKPADAFITGGVVIINVILGAFQEFRAKQKLDQIALLTRPKVTVIRDGAEQQLDQGEVVLGDALVLRSGDQAVVDGTRIAVPGQAGKRLEMDESLLTGEADLITKHPGDPILSGSFCVVGEGVYLAEKVGEASFAQKITAGAREYTQMITPLQRQISLLVRGLVVLSLALSIMLALSYAYRRLAFTEAVEDTAVVISLVPQGLLLMITVAYALGAIRIAGKGAVVQQSNAIESLSNVNVLCLDKTGTLTTNRILFHGLHPLSGEIAPFQQQLGDFIASTGAQNRTAQAVAAAMSGTARPVITEIAFSSARKWSAASFEDGTYVFGAAEMIAPALQADDQLLFAGEMRDLANQGLRVLLFAHSPQVIHSLPEKGEPPLPAQLKPIGLVSFSDELRPNVRTVLDNFRLAGIKLKLISGDSPDTVASLAYQAGFDVTQDRAISGLELEKMKPGEFASAVQEHAIFGRITPEQKQAIVEALKAQGHYVAMIGDGVNDVLSLKKAQVGIAMEDGSQATRSVADIVLLGNKFEILPDAFLEGQRILNAMNDTMRLFLTRTFYTALLIIVVGFIGAEFPLTPRHNYILTTFPVGTPAVFLTAWAKTGTPKRSLLANAAQFVLPAGFSMMVATVFVWILYLTYGGAPTQQDILTGRTVLTVSGMLGGLWIIIVSEHDRETWRQGLASYFKDKRRLYLAGAMGTIFLGIMLIPPLRDFFQLTPLSLADLGTIAATMIVWAIGLHLLLRYDILERMLIPYYGKDQA